LRGLKKLKVRVKTGQHLDEVLGFDTEGVLIVKVKAPPRQGKANQSLLALLARRFRIPKSEIKIARGIRSAQKLLYLPDAAELPPRTDT
jgi:uncharacterized protein (TIGR00251 family)